MNLRGQFLPGPVAASSSADFFANFLWIQLHVSAITDSSINVPSPVNTEAMSSVSAASLLSSFTIYRSQPFEVGPIYTTPPPSDHSDIIDNNLILAGERRLDRVPETPPSEPTSMPAKRGRPSLAKKSESPIPQRQAGKLPIVSTRQKLVLAPKPTDVYDPPRSPKNPSSKVSKKSTPRKTTRSAKSAKTSSRKIKAEPISQRHARSAPDNSKKMSNVLNASQAQGTRRSGRIQDQSTALQEVVGDSQQRPLHISDEDTDQDELSDVDGDDEDESSQLVETSHHKRPDLDHGLAVIHAQQTIDTTSCNTLHQDDFDTLAARGVQSLLGSMLPASAKVKSQAPSLKPASTILSSKIRQNHTQGDCSLNPQADPDGLASGKETSERNTLSRSPGNVQHASAAAAPAKADLVEMLKGESTSDLLMDASQNSPLQYDKRMDKVLVEDSVPLRPSLLEGSVDDNHAAVPTTALAGADEAHQASQSSALSSHSTKSMVPDSYDLFNDNQAQLETSESEQDPANDRPASPRPNPDHQETLTSNNHIDEIELGVNLDSSPTLAAHDSPHRAPSDYSESTGARSKTYQTSFAALHFLSEPVKATSSTGMLSPSNIVSHKRRGSADGDVSPGKRIRLGRMPLTSNKQNASEQASRYQESPSRSVHFMDDLTSHENHKLALAVPLEAASGTLLQNDKPNTSLQTFMARSGDTALPDHASTHESHARTSIGDQDAFADKLGKIINECFAKQIMPRIEAIEFDIKSQRTTKPPPQSAPDPTHYAVHARQRNHTSDHDDRGSHPGSPMKDLSTGRPIFNNNKSNSNSSRKGRQVTRPRAGSDDSDSSDSSDEGSSMDGSTLIEDEHLRRRQWIDSLQKHQKSVFEELQDISEALTINLIDKEQAVERICTRFKREGDMLISAAHSERAKTVQLYEERLDSTATRLKRNLTSALKELSSNTRTVATLGKLDEPSNTTTAQVKLTSIISAW
ncbi:hypothetical protein KVT40_008586 [Elsinoe batatas]|uniref:Uncharacterized protein n=1 Tax=Elsinoe batatas TaxID=2601811 RepID=A0A8K0P9N2_9PEZI|nr:hypothetical protein KVT40_008586 [Elsinoe batatas]